MIFVILRWIFRHRIFSSLVAFAPPEEIRFTIESKGFSFRQTIMLLIISSTTVTPNVVAISAKYLSKVLYRKANWNQRNKREPAKATGTKEIKNPKIIDIE